MITRMLVPLDGSPASEAALAYAELIPSEQVTLVTVVDEDDVRAAGSISGAETAGREYLEGHAEGLRSQGRAVEARVERGDVAERILDASQNADLVVMATYGRGGAGMLGLGSVADRVARHASAPTLVVRGKDQAVAPPVARVVVPLDGSALSEQALPHAMALADDLGVPMLLVRVLDMGTLSEAARLGNYAAARYVEMLDTVHSAARGYLSRHEQTVRRHDIAVTTQLLEGSPANELLGVVRHGDIVVMTTHGRSGVRRWLLGSVADKLVRHAAGPVLLVRPREEQDDTR